MELERWDSWMDSCVPCRFPFGDESNKADQDYFADNPQGLLWTYLK